MKKFALLFAALVILLGLVAACGPSPTPEVVVKVVTVEIEKPVEVEKVVTQEVEKEVMVTKEVEKEVIVEVPVVETVEVEKVVTETVVIEVEVTPTPLPMATAEPEPEVQAEVPSNIVTSWVITQMYTFPVEGVIEQYEEVVYAYDVLLVTDTLVLPTDVITVAAERDYGHLTFTRQGETEPALEVVLDDQAVAHLLWAWSHDNFAEPTLGELSKLHWIYRNERSPESGNNLSYSKDWGWYINEEDILFSTFDWNIPKVGAITQAVVLGPEMSNYGNPLEEEGIDAWARWFDAHGIDKDPLGVYEPL